ncbi:MAG TPA: hypothetical protein VFV54_08390 [Thermoanaerobaculia bacterium]|nr:hypothetical protein [Thermoanaerobaculia bacterium]
MSFAAPRRSQTGERRTENGARSTINDQRSTKERPYFHFCS